MKTFRTNRTRLTLLLSLVALLTLGAAPPAWAANKAAEDTLDEDEPPPEKPRAKVAKPKSKPARARVQEVVDDEEELDTADDNLAKARTWYRPSRTDAELPWNDRDPWNGAWRVAFFGSSHTMGTLGTTSSQFKGTGGLAGLEAGGNRFAVRLGTYSPSSSLVIGAGAPQFGTMILKDFGVPDMQIGLVFGSAMFHIVPAYWAMGVEMMPVGVRGSYEDFVVCNLGLIVGGWTRPQVLGIAYSYGLTLSAGVVF